MPGRALIHGLLILCAMPGMLSAEPGSPTDYFADQSLILEVRYCACPATDSESGPSDVLPRFLNDSHILKVDASVDEAGFVASQAASMGFKLQAMPDSPGRFGFEYVGSYGNSTGQGRFVLDEGEWLPLFGSRHDSESGSQYSSVAVRLTIAGGT